MLTTNTTVNGNPLFWVYYSSLTIQNPMNECINLITSPKSPYSMVILASSTIIFHYLSKNIFLNIPLLYPVRHSLKVKIQIYTAGETSLKKT